MCNGGILTQRRKAESFAARRQFADQTLFLGLARAHQGLFFQNTRRPIVEFSTHVSHELRDSFLRSFIF